ncbi:MAG: HEAT repeat domain-containing protein [Cyanobacteria bacterium J06635_10]
MTNNQNQPNQYDAVLGGNAPPPVTGAVLGGIEGVKKRLASADVKAQVAALKEALNYEEEGLQLVLQGLEDNHRKIRQAAVELLQDRNETQAKLALKNYKFWNGFERLDGLPCGHATTFANRKVIKFDQKIGITDTVDTAYAFWDIPDESSEMSIEERLQILEQEQQKRLAQKVEALVFGYLENIEDAVLKALEKFTNVKAIFIGDIEDCECMISSINLPNVSPILQALPQLEVLKIRGGSRDRFDEYCSGENGVFNPPLKHDNLKALTIESGGLSRAIITQFCQLELPALEYLELWMGSNRYGGDSSIEDVMPIISGKFPRIKYLGLRNSEYADEIAFSLVDSPITENLIELDLSMGTLIDPGAEALLNCSAIHQLDTLDIRHNYLTDEMVQRFNQLDIEVLNDNQEYFDEDDEDDEDDDENQRYCTVAE